ncbi:MAG: acetoacetate--CoA ligase [Rhodobacterales bacterium]
MSNTSQPLWVPSKDRVESSLLAKFITDTSSQSGNASPDYDTLWNWSVSDPEGFWSALWDFCGVVGDKSGPVLVDKGPLIDAQFCPECKINFAENLLAHANDAPCIIFHSENGDRVEWSWDDLKTTVSKLQQALIAEGIVAGDRVAGFLPNLPEAIAAMLAVTSLGGVWSSCSPDFGLNGVKDRFGQIEPKVLFTADAYHYNGKTHSSLEVAAELAAAIPSIQKVIVIPYVNAAADIDILGRKGAHWADVLGRYEARDIAYTRLDFAAPLYIMFSSGTTGLPKCIVHSVGGALLQHLKEHQFQCDVHPGDRLFFFTTCGWMMWNWLVTGLASGATLMLYDGSPFYPDGHVLVDIAVAERVTHFGTSAKYIDACAKAGINPAKTHDLSALRTIMSTGSPLAPEGFDYIYKDWKADVCLSSVAGGTDIMACFVGGSPISPVYRGQCQKRQLGMNVQVFDENYNALQGTPGELVCTSAHPSMPIGFWDDPDRKRYHAAYFEKFDNVWYHGDWVELTREGGMIFFGRSDAVLNPGGVRIGTAEIYRQVERIEEVLEGLVIGQQWDNDVRVVLFVRLREGVRLDDALIKRIKTEIRENATPRHMPAKVIAVADIPRTKSGKITELAVRDVVHGRPVKNTEAMANPEALELFKDLDALKS